MLPGPSSLRPPTPALIDYFEAGDRLDDFLADYPTVTREQAIAVLELARKNPNRTPSTGPGTQG